MISCQLTVGIKVNAACPCQEPETVEVTERVENHHRYPKTHTHRHRDAATEELLSLSLLSHISEETQTPVNTPALVSNAGQAKPLTLINLNAVRRRDAG